MHCVSCGFANPEGMEFCTECGMRLQNTCPQCQFANALQAKFCGKCGTSLTGRRKTKRGNGETGKRRTSRSGARLQTLDSSRLRTPNSRPISYTPHHLTERILAERAAMEARGATDGERKTITALFADIKGSMALIENLDPEEARAIVDPALTIMMEAAHRYDGFVAQSTGDGIFAFFGAPLAHEDHPQRALYAALRMQEEIRRYSDRLRAVGHQPIQARVGANTGEVVMRSVSTGAHAEYVPVGHSTSLAA